MATTQGINYYDDLPVLPLPLPPGEVYAMLMEEPDLLLPESDLREKYKHETDEEREERGKRYAKAFEGYERRYSAYIQRWRQLFRRYKRKVNAYVEQWEKSPPV